MKFICPSLFKGEESPNRHYTRSQSFVNFSPVVDEFYLNNNHEPRNDVTEVKRRSKSTYPGNHGQSANKVKSSPVHNLQTKRYSKDKTNRSTVIVALTHCLFRGGVNEDTRNRQSG